MSDARKRFGRTEMVEILQHQTGMSASQADKTVSILIKAMILALKEGCLVQIPSIGILCTKYVPPRTGFHPMKNRLISIRPRIGTQFRASKTLKRALNLDVETMKNRIESEE